MSIAEPLLSPDPEVLSPQEDELLVSVVIPCLNEAANIERCVSWALATLAENGIVAATGTRTWPASPPLAGATS